MAYGFTRTLPAITGNHSDAPVLLVAGSFPATAIDGGASSIDNGGGNLRAYTDDTKSTQLSLHVVEFVTGGSPDIQLRVKIPSAFTGATIYLEADSVATTQPAVGAAFGRNAVYASELVVLNNESTSPIDVTGNGNDGASGAGVSVVAGKIGSALNYNNTSSAWTDFGPNEAIRSDEPFNIRMWIKPVISENDMQTTLITNNPQGFILFSTPPRHTLNLALDPIA